MLSIKTFFLTFIFLFISPLLTADDLAIEDAWIREAPPVSRVQAAYATLKNNDKNDIKVTSAASPAFKKIEFHTTTLKNGLMSMQQQPTIHIAAKGEVKLEPEGMHMMLFDPTKPIRAGEKININFTFSNGTSTTFLFTVKKATTINHHQHMHH